MIIWLAEDGGSSIPTDKQRELMDLAADACIAAEGISDDEGFLSVSVSFVEEDEIKELNRRFRDTDSVTDVLSFPMYGDRDELMADLDMIGEEAGEDSPEEISLGDVVICGEKIRQQAAEYGHSEDRELVYLFVHSMLHLLGYDHLEDEERKLMRAEEDRIMEGLGLER